MHSSKQYGVVVFTRSHKMSTALKSIVQFSYTYEDEEDPINKTEIRFTRSLKKALSIVNAYDYSILVIDWSNVSSPLSALFPYIKSMPGYKSIDYSHLTYIKTKQNTEALRVFMKQVPLTHVIDGTNYNLKRIRKSLSFLGEVFTNSVNHSALQKFFDLYDQGEYERAYDLAEIMYDRQPQREFLYLLLQSARNSFEYQQDDRDDSQTIAKFELSPDLLNAFGVRNKFLKARQFYQEGKNELANQIFNDLFALDAIKSKTSLVDTFLWMFERFTAVVKCKADPLEVTKLHDVCEFTKAIEPRFRKSYLNFETLEMRQINRGIYNCRLDMELAILANVAAFYFSNIGEYETATLIYSMASCFLFRKSATRITTLQNLQSCYKKSGKLKQAMIVGIEIKKIESVSKKQTPENISELAS